MISNGLISIERVTESVDWCRTHAVSTECCKRQIDLGGCQIMG